MSPLVLEMLLPTSVLANASGDAIEEDVAVGAAEACLVLRIFVVRRSSAKAKRSRGHGVGGAVAKTLLYNFGCMSFSSSGVCGKSDM